jgi:hypothetical protein
MLEFYTLDIFPFVLAYPIVKCEEDMIWNRYMQHQMRHKGSMDPLLVRGEGLFHNDCFLGEVVTWMKDLHLCKPMYIKFVASYMHMRRKKMPFTKSVAISKQV